MHDPSSAAPPAPPAPALPPDDPARTLAHARPDAAGSLPHLALAGDTYTVLLTGADTAGRFTLIDMYVPPGGGPPPHRHDFEETFSLLDGEIAFTFRGDPWWPAPARRSTCRPTPRTRSATRPTGPARMLCVCAPAGQEQFFLALGARVGSRTAPPPSLSDAEQADLRARAAALAPQYRTEFLPPAHDPPRRPV
jgi:hypothetical protein